MNVPYDVYTIQTKITKEGSKIEAGEYVDYREKLSRKKRWEQLDDDENYASNKLDKEVVAPDQIRTIIRTFRNKLPEIFPFRKAVDGEFDVPKTLIFAKSDSHADDIISTVREEFDEGNEFCKKVTYRATEDPKSVLSQFRNSYYPRIAVTVDMIATGTDVKPLECLLFMRDVKSSNYFEQMKGRGTRTISHDDLQKVTPSATSAKTHFVIVDAVGATKSKKTASRALEKKPSSPLKLLLEAISAGQKGEELFSSIANRLIRLDKQLTDNEKKKFKDLAKGKSIKQVVRELLEAYDPDKVDELSAIKMQEKPELFEEDVKKEVQDELILTAQSTFNGKLNSYIDQVRKVHEQLIDHISRDTVISADWDKTSIDKAQEMVQEFSDYLAEHRDEISALKIFYGEPYRRRELTFSMVRELFDKLKADKPLLSPLNLWNAYEQFEQVKGGTPQSELVALVSLVRRALGIDSELTAYDKTVDGNFKKWIFAQNAGKHNRFTEEQMAWLKMIKEQVSSSFHMEIDDLDYTPFDAQGGRMQMYQLFGDGMNDIINELNEVLTA